MSMMQREKEGSGFSSASDSSEDSPLLVTSHTNTMTESRSWFRQVSLPVYLLVLVFAMSSWVDINGLWVELPLLVNELPEGWALPSYLSIIIQLANIGPLIYTVAHHIRPTKVKEWPVVYLIIGLGSTACLLLVFFWRTTAYQAGAYHSVALFALAGLLAFVDCTSSVVYLPYMGAFKPQYMTAFYVGEGLSGMVPGILGLIQGLDAQPACHVINTTVHNVTTGLNHTEQHVIPIFPPQLFSVEVFFGLLFVLLILSSIAFTIIHFGKFAQKARISDTKPVVSKSVNSKTYHKPTESAGDEDQKADCLEYDVPFNSGDPLNNKGDIDMTVAPPVTDPSMIGLEEKQSAEVSLWKYIFLLVITFWLCAITNGLLPSVQSYSALPYGSMAYTLVVRLSSIANPVACFIALFLPSTSVALVGALVTLGTALSAYQLALGLMSPQPPLVATPEGSVLVVVTAVALTAAFSYSKVVIATILQQRGHRALLWCGVLTQAGSLVGAIISFVLVNVLHLLTSIPPCAQSPSFNSTMLSASST